MAEVGADFVSIVPSAKNFSKVLDGQISGDLDKSGKSGGKRFGGAFAGAFKAVAGPALALVGVAAVTGFLKDAIGEARESQKVGAVTAQVIKSTGAAAKITANQVGDLSTAISNHTGIDDEAIQSGANLLLTFKNIRNEAGKGNDIFNQTTSIMTDMSAAMGTEPKAAAIQLGKALNDPVKGITALTRVGVTFSDSQKAAIKSMVASGDTMGAQKIILAELNSEFGGTAAAAATAGEKFSTTFGNFKESIGTALLPILDKVLGAATSFVTYLMANVGPAFAAVGRFIAPAVAAVKGFLAGLSGGAGGGPLAGFVASLKAGFSAVLPVLLSVGQAIVTNVLPVLQRLGAFFTGTVLPAISTVVSYIVASVVPIFQKVGQIIATQVLPIIGSLASFFVGTLMPAAFSVYKVIASNLKPIFDQLVATFQAKVLPAASLVLAKFKEWLPTIQAVISIVVKVIGKVLEFAAAILGKVLPVVIRFAGFLIGTVVSAVVAVIGVVVKMISTAISFGTAIFNAGKKAVEFASTVRTKIGEALGLIGGIPGKVKGYFSKAGSLLINAGSEIIGGLLRGITQKFEDVKNFVGGIGSWISDHKGPISYDRKLLVPHGKAIMHGLDEGLKAGLPAVTKTAKAVAKRVAEAAATKLKVTKSQADVKAWITATLVPGLTSSSADTIVSTIAALQKKVQAAFTAAAGSSKAAQTAAIGRAAKFVTSLKSQTSALSKVAAQRIVVAGQLKDAQDKLAEAIKVRDDFAQSVADNLSSWGAITGTTSGDDNPLTSSSIISQMASRLASLKDFAGNLASLRSAGLNDTTYAQLVQAGAEQGGQLAAALLSGGVDAVNQVNTLSDQINLQAKSLGATAAKTLYQAGVDAAQGLVNGLKSQEAALLATADRIAAQIVARLKSALKIHSPSRVMADQIGVPMAQGIAVGFAKSIPGLERTVLSAVPRVQPAPLSRSGGVDGGDGLAFPDMMRLHPDDLDYLARKVGDRVLTNARTGAR